MSKIADDAEAIARRLKELEADRQLALTGSTVAEPKVTPVDSVYGSYGDYAIGFVPAFTGVSTGGTSSLTLTIDQLPPYTPKQVNG